jgi:hypothetical protein
VEEEQPPPVVPPSPPGAPGVVNATAGDASATVSWGPAADNRSAITGYQITWNGGQTTVPGNAQTTVIPGLANGTTYTFTVTAINAVGTGPGAASNPVTPIAPTRPASEPTNVAVNRTGSTVTMSWAQPADLGGGTLLHYVVSANGQDTVTTGQTFTFNNITSTTTFTVRAVTQTPNGQVDGASASRTVDVPNGTVQISQGAPTQQECAGDPDCAFVHVVLTNMQPNTTYTLTAQVSGPTPINGSGSCTTDANGSCTADPFAYHEEGQTVTVTARAPDGTATQSNNLVWETNS